MGDLNQNLSAQPVKITDDDAVAGVGRGVPPTDAAGLYVRPIQDTQTFYHGRNSQVTPVASPLTTLVNIDAFKGVVIKASVDNTDKIYVGRDLTVTADESDLTDGFELDPGESISVLTDHPNTICVIARSGVQKVFWLSI